MINQDPPPPDDRGYERYLAALAKECRCCVACVNPPCPGLEAGGFCDGYCGCPEGDDEDEDDFDESVVTDSGGEQARDDGGGE